MLLVRLSDVPNDKTLVDYLKRHPAEDYESAFDSKNKWRPRVLLLLDAYDEARTPGASFYLSFWLQA